MFFHLSTPRGEGGIAVFELFGEDAERVVERVFRGPGLPASGRSRLGNLVDARGESLDEVLVSRQHAGSMWCGLDAWTISVHGGIWIQERVASLLGELGAERVERADVLLRSTRVGGLDTLQAAAFELLIEARTERAAAFLLRQHGGELSRALGRLCARIETIGRHDAAARCAVAGELRPLLDRFLELGAVALRLAHPLRVLIAGPPNAGKSTLFNRLAEETRVAVSPRAGTTRDLQHATIAVDGFPVEIIDGAGLRERPDDVVEAEAIRRVRAFSADAVIYLLAPPWSPTALDREFLGRFGSREAILVANFADRSDIDRRDALTAGCELLVSALDGRGVERLLEALAARFLGARAIGTGDASMDAALDGPAPFTARQIEIIGRARRVLERAPACPSSAALDAVRRVLVLCCRSSWP